MVLPFVCISLFQSFFFLMAKQLPTTTKKWGTFIRNNAQLIQLLYFQGTLLGNLINFL